MLQQNFVQQQMNVPKLKDKIKQIKTRTQENLKNNIVKSKSGMIASRPCTRNCIWSFSSQFGRIYNTLVMKKFDSSINSREFIISLITTILHLKVIYYIIIPT